MSMQLSEKLKRSSFITLTLLTIILIIGLIALVEKGPVVPGVPIGASPLSPLSLGTLELAYMLKRNYTVIVVTEQSLLNYTSGDICVFTTISPEKPFTLEESLEIVNTLKTKCHKLKILIADESTSSNSILEAVNSTIRISGDRILFEPLPILITPQLQNYTITITFITNTTSKIPEPGLFYPLVLIHIVNNHTLILDKASSVSGGIPIGYVLANETSEVYLLNPNSIGVRMPPGKKNVTVASREIVDDVEVLVIGDGSIFLNQVLLSNRTEYKLFIEELFKYLCEDNSKCTIIIDATHYTVLAVSSDEALTYLAEQITRGDVRSLLYVIALITPILIHPATWLPPLISAISSGYVELIKHSISAMILTAILTLITYNALLQHKISVRDKPLREQVEEELGVFRELKKHIFTRITKLSAQDYISVYIALDNLIQLVWGLRLEDPRVLDNLTVLLGDREKASKMLQWIRRLYLKASGRSRLPLVLSWSRAVKKLVEIVEEISDKISEKYGAEFV